MHDHQRTDDADRHVPLRIPALLRGGRDRVEADIGEEDCARAHHQAADAEGAELAGVRRKEGLVVGGIDVRPAHADEDQDHRQLDGYDHRIGARRFLDADHEQHGDQKDDDHGRNIRVALRHGAVRQRHHFERAGDPLNGQIDVERVEQRNHVGGPTDRHRGRADGVFDHQVPADDPGDPFAQRGVGVGVGAAGHRDHAREFAVAQAGERAADRGDHHGDGHRGSGILRRRHAGQGKQARADNRADAQGDQLHRTQGALELMRRHLPIRTGYG